MLLLYTFSQILFALRAWRMDYLPLKNIHSYKNPSTMSTNPILALTLLKHYAISLNPNTNNFFHLAEVGVVPVS